MHQCAWLLQIHLRSFPASRRTIWWPAVCEASSYALIRETSNSTFRLSPTRNPPVSSAAFQLRPKSLRLILVVAEAPILAFPQGSFVSADGISTLRTTSLVTPWIVRLPSNRSSSPCIVISLLLTLIVGSFSTSRKSALFSCVSRAASRVLIVLPSITTSTLDEVGFSGSYTTLPCT